MEIACLGLLFPDELLERARPSDVICCYAAESAVVAAAAVGIYVTY